jgi:hypothetical protein
MATLPWHISDPWEGLTQSAQEMLLAVGDRYEQEIAADRAADHARQPLPDLGAHEARPGTCAIRDLRVFGQAEK